MSPNKNMRLNSVSETLVEVSDSSNSLQWPKPIIPCPLTDNPLPIEYLPLILNARVYDISVETPLQHARKLSERLKSTIYLKREDAQPIYSFKCRGAFNKMFHLSKAQKDAGVACVSAGNHAQGVAMAAKQLGVRATIVMPTFAPEIKVENVKRLGANVILFGNDFDEAKKECFRLVAEERLTYVPPFDDPLVIAGQGTVGMEILSQIRQTRLDAIFVCCGGGGLLSGIAAYVKQVRPEVKVIGVNTVDSNSMYQSLLQGSPVELKKVGLFADGTSVKLVGKHCFDICKRFVDDMVLVTNDEICSAIKDCYDESRTVLEPAGALGIAGLKKYLKENPILRGGVFVGVCSGANMNFDRLRFVAERAAIGDGKEVLLSVLIPEKPGTLRRLYEKIYPRFITELSYRRADDEEAHVFVGFHTTGIQDTNLVLQKLQEEGFQVNDITDNVMASQHVRYMSGGRVSEQVHEYIFRMVLPERAGVFSDMFNEIQLGWSITLLHYRNHGSDYGRVLLGIQISDRTDETIAEFRSNLKAVGVKEIVEETSNPVYQYFMKI